MTAIDRILQSYRDAAVTEREKGTYFERLAEVGGAVIRALMVMMAATLALPASAQNFSCRIGTEPACLDYGDTICSSRGMCMDRNSLCFDRYQCDFEGFTCRSNVTECVDDYEDLLSTHNDLVDDFNDNLEIARSMERRLQDVESCLVFAASLAEARQCAR